MTRETMKIPKKVWDEKKADIARLYQEEGYPLKLLIRKLQSDDFQPTESQLRSRLKRWEVRKERRSHKTPRSSMENPEKSRITSPRADVMSSPDPEDSTSEDVLSSASSPNSFKPEINHHRPAAIRPLTTGMPILPSQQFYVENGSYQVSPTSPQNNWEWPIWNQQAVPPYTGILPSQDIGIISPTESDDVWSGMPFVPQFGLPCDPAFGTDPATTEMPIQYHQSLVTPSGPEPIAEASDILYPHENPNSNFPVSAEGPQQGQFQSYAR